MTDESHVDGNALGGLLFEVFGREMTDQMGCCGECGSVSAFGTLIAYREAPGDVMRCPACGTVLIVVVPVPTGVRVTFESIRWMEVQDG